MNNLGLKRFSYLILSAIAAFWYSRSLNNLNELKASALKPILPLAKANLHIDTWYDILNDSHLEVQVESDIVAKEVEIDIKELSQELKAIDSKIAQLKSVKDAKNSAQKLVENRRKTLRTLYRRLASFNRYLLEAASGRINSKIYSSKRASILLKKSHNQLYKTVNDYVEATTSTKEQAIARYHSHAQQYLEGEVNAHQYLSKNKKDLPELLRLQVTVLEAYHSQKPLNRRQIKDLNIASKRLGRNGQAACHLILARWYAHKKSNSYRNHLETGLTLSNRFEDRSRLKLLQFGLTIWRQVEPKGSWSKAPIPPAIFDQSMSMRAVEERAILEGISHGGIQNGLTAYRQLVEQLEGSSYMAAIDQRIIGLEAAIYKKSDKITPYEQELTRLIAKYNQSKIQKRNPELFGKTKVSFERRYYDLTFGRLDRAEQRTRHDTFSMEAISLANRFIKWSPSFDHKTRAKDQVARIYAKQNKHHQAVIVLDDLLDSGPKAAKANYTVRAISSQSNIARWPTKAPMDESISKRLTAGQSQDRVKLMSYYNSLNNMSSKLDWQLIGHIGMLHISLGQIQKAFDIWTPALSKDGQRQEAQLAAARMLVSYQQNHRWQRLEELADICINGKIKPQGYHVQSLPYYLASSLYYGGKESYNHKNFRNAWMKLARFNKTFQKDPRRDETMYLIAHAYRGDNRHMDAIKSLISHTTTYKTSVYRTNALLLGGNWAKGMALEEQVIYFYQSYLNENPDHQTATKVRKVLVGVYLALGHYGDAGRLYKQQALDKKLPLSDRVIASLAQMNLEEQYGNRSSGEWGARQALNLTTSPDVQITVLAFRARNVVHSGHSNTEAIKELMNQADRIQSKSRIAQEYLGQIRFFYAQTKEITQPEDIFNLTIQDHYKVLEQQYDRFLKARSYFDRVCQAGETSFCAPALHKISTMTQVAIKSIEQIQIPDSLEEQTVKKFNTYKDDAIANLSQIAIATAGQAVELAKQGMAAPQFTYEILDEASNLSQATEGLGYTYTQWNTGR